MTKIDTLCVYGSYDFDIATTFFVNINSIKCIGLIIYN